MYSTVIEFSKEISDEELGRLKQKANEAFNSQMERLDNVSKEKYVIQYEGNKDKYASLQLGILLLNTEDFVKHVIKWEWIDEIAENNVDILATDAELLEE